MSKIFCCLCNKEVPVKGRHFQDIHNILAREYYDMYIKQPKQGICDYNECNNNTSFGGVKVGYQQYCSTGCSRRGKPRSIITKNKISTSRKIWLETPAGIEHNNNLSINRRGKDNPVHKQTKETRRRVALNNSIKLKQLILTGQFTPCVTNSWCKSRIVLDNIPFRSNWEAAFYIINKAPSLKFEKLRIPYILDGITKIYIVDFIDEEHRVVYEIKPDSNLICAKNKAKLEALLMWSIENNYSLKIIGNSYFKANANKINFANYNISIYNSMKQFLEYENN